MCIVNTKVIKFKLDLWFDNKKKVDEGGEELVRELWLLPLKMEKGAEGQKTWWPLKSRDESQFAENITCILWVSV